MGGETHALPNYFEVAYSIAYDIQKILGRSVTVTVLPDSESLFKSLVESSTKAEKRLTIDIRDAREAFKKREITNIVWIRSDSNIANELTKETCVALEELLLTRILRVHIDQWIERVELTSCDEIRTSSCYPASNER